MYHVYLQNDSKSEGNPVENTPNTIVSGETGDDHF